MDIKINDTEWNSLGGDEQKKIEEMVGGFFKGAKIVPDTSVPASGVQAQAAPASVFCEIACSIAEAAAIAGCQALPPPANAVCVVAAKAAGDACRRAC